MQRSISDRDFGTDPGGPYDRWHRPSLRRRLRRRHAAHRRPFHLGQRPVRQRPGHPARVSRGDQGPGRHAGRSLVVPGPHLRPRHHHPRRCPDGAGGHEPGRTPGRPASAQTGRDRHRQRGRLQRAQPGQGRIRVQPAGGRQPRRLHGGHRPHDRPHQAGLPGSGRQAPRRRAVQELLRPRAGVVAVLAPRQAHRRLDRRQVRGARHGDRSQQGRLRRRPCLRRDRRAGR